MPIIDVSTSYWCGWQDLNPHALAMEPKSIVSANFTTSALYNVVTLHITIWCARLFRAANLYLSPDFAYTLSSVSCFFASYTPLSITFMAGDVEAVRKEPAGCRGWTRTIDFKDMSLVSYLLLYSAMFNLLNNGWISLTGYRMRRLVTLLFLHWGK